MAGIFTAAGYYSERLPSEITAVPSSEVKIAEYPELRCFDRTDESVVAAGAVSDTRQVTAALFGAIPVKTITVREAERPVLAAGGEPFGIKLLMDGVMVTELGGVSVGDGEAVCPAGKAGIEVGDIIKSANGRAVLSNGGLQDIIAESGGADVKLEVVRDKKEFTVTLSPEFSSSTGNWRCGMWVRDSIAGIGTMTFFSKKTGEFAGLGHPICDSDTGELVPLYSGEAVPVEIGESQKGEKGIPGELRGKFVKERSYGTLSRNNSCGIFGRLNAESLAELDEAEEFELAYRQEVTTGEAEILSTVKGSKPERYTAEIEKTDLSGGNSLKDMVIRITDKRLIDEAGGIVQGMSGSPIIQNGKLVGAVTHVFVADPTRGYGIFAERMAEYLEG